MHGGVVETKRDVRFRITLGISSLTFFPLRVCLRPFASSRLLLLLAIALVTTGCHDPGTVDLQIGQKEFEVELARTEAQQEKGLMERDSMPADHGMLFIFTEEKELNFWMKNTRIPLDILFLDHAGRIVSIHTMKPYDLTPTPSDYPATYAIELNAGAADAAPAHVGDTISIPTSARAP
jgi:uncharacterized membrane protein (UPF0127 family)